MVGRYLGTVTVSRVSAAGMSKGRVSVLSALWHFAAANMPEMRRTVDLT
jgi:hypothetical protein